MKNLHHCSKRVQHEKVNRLDSSKIDFFLEKGRKRKKEHNQDFFSERVDFVRLGKSHPQPQSPHLRVLLIGDTLN